MPIPPRPMTPGQGPGAPPSRLPRSPVGGPNGPGGSPMLSPGGGAGSQAAAMAKIATVNEQIKEAMMAFDTNSKEFQSCMRAITALNSVAGTKKADDLAPASNMQSRTMGGRPAPLAGSPPPGIAAPAPFPPPMTPPGMGAI